MYSLDTLCVNMSVVLYPDTEKYLSNFYNPEISSYEFFKCFFAALYLRGEREITRELTDFIYRMRQLKKYNKVLKEITFRSNGIFWYSNEIEDDILMLQNVGLLGKRNPSFGRILIDYNDEIALEIQHSLDDGDWGLIDEIAGKFIEEAN